MTTTSTAPETTLTGDYSIDPDHSRLGFTARHAMVASVHGHFLVFDGVVHLDEAHPENSRAEVRIDTASINTGSVDRDAHLRSADFFDVEKWPTMRFTSTAARQSGEDTYVLEGDLTIRDVTRQVEVEFEHTGTAVDPEGNFRAGFEGRTTVNRRDWGLTWNLALEAGGILVGDKVKLVLDVAAVKQA